MIRTREFDGNNAFSVDEKINDFLDRYSFEYIDVKYQVVRKSKYGYLSKALLIYKA